MKKAFFASFCSLTAIACALWLFLYTIVNDLMRAPFSEESLIETFKLFGPAVGFVLCGLGYIRIRRAMDKEKLVALKLKQEAFNSLFIVPISELTARALLDTLPEGRLTGALIGSELTAVLNELRFTYYRFYRDGGRKEEVAISMIALLERLDRDMPPAPFLKK